MSQLSRRVSVKFLAYIDRSIWHIRRFVSPPLRRNENAGMGPPPRPRRFTSAREPRRNAANDPASPSARDQIFLYINVASFQCRTCPAYLGRWCYLYTVSSLCIRLVCPVQWAAWQLISDQETNTSLPLCCRAVPPFDSPLRYFDCSLPTYVPLLLLPLVWLLTVPSS